MIFVFKQKTAYEMRISDWSSDVCSSDLLKDAVSMAGMQLYLNSGAPSLIIVAVRGDDTVIDAYGETAPGNGVEPDEHSIRSEERRVGKEGVSTCRSRWSQYH